MEGCSRIGREGQGSRGTRRDLEANPTTGYQWVVLDPGVVELTSESHDPQSNAVGAGGNTILTFSPIARGTADLTLGYLRPWEVNVEPIDTFTVTISVTG